MYISFDDTDSRNAMCTTFLVTELIRTGKYDLIGYPSLVRLNPNIPYKTRGNGAVRVRVGRGTGNKTLCGYIRGDPVYSYEESEGEEDPESIFDDIYGIVEKNYQREENTNPGMVVSPDLFPEYMYKEAVTGEVGLDHAVRSNMELGSKFGGIGNGRGIIGSSAAMAWRGKRMTYEIIGYREGAHQIPEDIKMEAALYADSVGGTFNSVDIHNRYPAIFPNPRTPVVYGIRGVNRDSLLQASDTINRKLPFDPDSVILFETNQGTDDHVEHYGGDLQDLHTYRITGSVGSRPFTSEGSHYFSTLNVSGREVRMAAFEPTKEFRSSFRQLLPGDFITVYGSFLKDTINIEKMEIHSISREYVRFPPICRECGDRMANRGKFSYECEKCRTRSSIPAYNEKKRWLKPGKYNVPVMARRHLSMPFGFSPIGMEKEKRELFA